MKRSILSLVILALFVTGFALVLGQGICQAGVNVGTYLTDDPNTPGAESSLTFGQVICLTEDPNDGGTAE